MQNGALGIPNGAIWKKLLPKTIYEPNSWVAIWLHLEALEDIEKMSPKMVAKTGGRG